MGDIDNLPELPKGWVYTSLEGVSEKIIDCLHSTPKFLTKGKYCIDTTKTEAFDRGDKFTDYSELEMLQEYVLINQKRMRVERFRRDTERRWVLYRYNEGDELHLDSIGFHCPISAVYEDVSFTPPEKSNYSNRHSERLRHIILVETFCRNVSTRIPLF